MLKKAIDVPGFCTNHKTCLGPNCEGCCHLTLREECVHGSLEAKCEICERDAEIARLRAELAAANAVIASVEAAYPNLQAISEALDMAEAAKEDAGHVFGGVTVCRHGLNSSACGLCAKAAKEGE